MPGWFQNFSPSFPPNERRHNYSSCGGERAQRGWRNEHVGEIFIKENFHNRATDALFFRLLWVSLKEFAGTRQPFVRPWRNDAKGREAFPSLSFSLSLSLPLVFSSFGSFNHRRKTWFRDYASYGIVYIEFFRDYRCRSRRPRSFLSGRKNLGQVAVRRCTRSRENRGLHRLSCRTASVVFDRLRLFRPILLSPPLFLSLSLFSLAVYDEYGIKTSKNVGKQAELFLAITREK